MDDRRGNVTAKNANHVVKISVGEFTVQRANWIKGEKVWVTCWINRQDSYLDGKSVSVPAIYEDISEADDQLNLFRDLAPMCEFRMIQTTTIVQVVYA